MQSKFQLDFVEETGNFGDTDADGRIIFKWIFKDVDFI
jgi:hypothetical protein